jgi:hypothetical protein
MPEKRMEPRYDTKGCARIHGIKDNLLLKNLSITGCCLDCNCTIEEIHANEIYKIEIKPEHEAKIGKFELLAECRWIRKKNHLNEIGFMVTESPKGKFFQNYVDYIDHHSN